MELTREELQEIMQAALAAVIVPPAEPAEAAEAPPERIHHNPRQFFDGYLSSVFARDLERDGVNWCPHWYEHPEAAQVMEALWSSWETLQRDPNTGLAVWFVQFAYPLMSRMFDSAGTFASCSVEAHMPPPPLPEE